MTWRSPQGSPQTRAAWFPLAPQIRAINPFPAHPSRHQLHLAPGLFPDREPPAHGDSTVGGGSGGGQEDGGGGGVALPLEDFCSLFSSGLLLESSSEPSQLTRHTW